MRRHCDVSRGAIVMISRHSDSAQDDRILLARLRCWLKYRREKEERGREEGIIRQSESRLRLLLRLHPSEHHRLNVVIE